MDILSIILLGLVQGVAEWLPISSKTMDSIVFLQVVGGAQEQLLSLLIFLHLGTLLAAIVYFRKNILELGAEVLKDLKDPKKIIAGKLPFYISALVMTGVVGVPILVLESMFLPSINASLLFAVMGAGLLITSFLLYSQKGGNRSSKTMAQAGIIDGALTGAMQGLSTIPGVSRSGTTTTALVWRGFEPKSTFELSFMLSIPTVICAEVVFWSYQMLKAGEVSMLPIQDGIMLAAASAIFGYLTIGLLLRVAQKINLWQFAGAFGLVMFIVGIIGLG